MNSCKICGASLSEPRDENCHNAQCPFRTQSDSNEKSNNFSQRESPRLSNLKVIKGDLFDTVKRVKRTQDLLTFSNAVLWPEKTFGELDQLTLHPLIAEHFRGSRDIDETFCELVERTVMAKRWIEEKSYRFIPSPKKWFDIDYIDGLYFTHVLYGRMLTVRNTIPNYEYGLYVLSHAVKQYSDTQNLLDIYPYREVLIRLNRIDLLQYYFNAIMHIQFINL